MKICFVLDAQKVDDVTRHICFCSLGIKLEISNLNSNGVIVTDIRSFFNGICEGRSSWKAYRESEINDYMNTFSMTSIFFVIERQRNKINVKLQAEQTVPWSPENKITTVIYGTVLYWGDVLPTWSRKNQRRKFMPQECLMFSPNTITGEIVSLLFVRYQTNSL